MLVAKCPLVCLFAFFLLLLISLAAACPLGVNSGDNCRVEDKVAGYVFDLSALAESGQNGKDYFTANDTQYLYQLKVSSVM